MDNFFYHPETNSHISDSPTVNSSQTGGNKKKSTTNIDFFNKILSIVQEKGFSCNSPKYRNNDSVCCLKWWKTKQYSNRLKKRLDSSKKLTYSKQLYKEIMSSDDYFSFPWKQIKQKEFKIRDFLVQEVFTVPVQQKNYFENTISNEYDDEFGVFKNVLTKFISTHIFDKKSNLFYFLTCIFTVFHFGIQQYCKEKGLFTDSIIFTYKGGNILRFIHRLFFRLLSGDSAEQFYDFYSLFFKKGDFDFGIFIHPLVPNYERVFQEVTLLNYYLQTKLRIFFLLHKTEFFSIFKYNEAYLNSQLRDKILTHIQEKDMSKNNFWKHKTILNIRFIGNSSALSEEEVLTTITEIIMNSPLSKQEKEERLTTAVDTYLQRTPFIGSGDLLLQFKKAINRNERMIDTDSVFYRKQNSEDKHILTINYNKTLQFYTNMSHNQPLLKMFHLIRTKLLFKIEYLDEHYHFGTSNINGELIDVSVSHRCSDIEMQSFYYDFNNTITKYSLSNFKDKFNPANINIGQNQIEFYSFSIPYIIEDLEKILYYEVEYPWKNNKYKKRIYRICFISFIQLLESISNNTLRMFYLSIFSKFCQSFLSQTIHNTSINKYYQQLLQFENKTNLTKLVSIATQKQYQCKPLTKSLYRSIVKRMNLRLSNNQDMIHDENSDSDGEDMYHSSPHIKGYLHHLKKNYTLLFFRMIHRIYKKIYPKIIDITNKQRKQKELQEFKEFIQVIQDNCKVLIHILIHNKNQLSNQFSLQSHLHRITTRDIL